VPPPLRCVSIVQEKEPIGYFLKLERGGWYAEMNGLPWGKHISMPKETSTEAEQDTILNAQVSPGTG